MEELERRGVVSRGILETFLGGCRYPS
jgi:hypothetical protein